METKPFSIQSPEAIAKEYGGNKQKIAQAMQMGIVDPTAGTLAGMFIDRMRAAAQQEQAPQQTVAQQVMAPQPPPPPPVPPAPPAGLGATPQAASMGPPPAMGQPSAPPPGMAEGGMVPSYMDGGMVPSYMGGGIADLPVPDDMFNESVSDNDIQQYAGGGIVAFAGGTPGEEIDEITVTAAGPESLYGNYRDPAKMRAAIDEQYKPERQYANALTELFKNVSSPEELKSRKKDDMWMALGQIGATMASTPGSFLQAAGAGINSALPGIAQATKERRADQRDAVKALAAQEGLSNREALEMAKLVQEGTNKYGEFNEKQLTRSQAERLAEIQEKGANNRTRISAAASMYGSDVAAGASRDVGGMALEREQLEQQGAALKLVYDQIGPGGALTFQYSQAVKAGTGKEFIAARVAELLGNSSGTSDIIMYDKNGNPVKKPT